MIIDAHTHVHPDHLDEAKVKAITTANPDVQIFSTQQVADQLSGTKVTIPEIGKSYDVGGFTLEFFGGKHASIRSDWPQDENFGVLVGDKLYYTGDSFTPCPKPHEVLAVAGSAPWLAIGETIDFVKQDNAERVFPTHNNIVNENGQDLIDMLVGGACEQLGKSYKSLKPGESIEV